MINITIPVYNEEIVLKDTIEKVVDFARKNISDDWLVIIADNNSNDKTEEIGSELDEKIKKVHYLRLDKKGKGYGISSAWLEYKADVYVFMDADLATDIKDIPVLIKEIKNGNDIVTGSRYMKKSKTKRAFGRNLFSFFSNSIIRLFLGIRIKDMPCGFKAVNQKVITNILPKIENQNWFFDTEMIYLSSKAGYKIKEIPVTWEEGNRERKSKVGMLKVSGEYLINILRLIKKAEKK